MALLGVLAWRAAHTVVDVGIWFDVDPASLPAHVTDPIGAPLTRGELAEIEQMARTELEQAFAGLRVSFSRGRAGFWKVEVLNDLVVNTDSPYAGWPSGVAESFLLGPLGGRATISLSSLTQFAIAHAPPGAGRRDVVAGIGRGVARAAAHELAHLIAAGDIHDDADPLAYEYPHADRSAQYYGELHWGSAWPLLARKIGK